MLSDKPSSDRDLEEATELRGLCSDPKSSMLSSTEESGGIVDNGAIEDSARRFAFARSKNASPNTLLPSSDLKYAAELVGLYRITRLTCEPVMLLGEVRKDSAAVILCVNLFYTYSSLSSSLVSSNTIESPLFIDVSRVVSFGDLISANVMVFSYLVNCLMMDVPSSSSADYSLLRSQSFSFSPYLYLRMVMKCI